MRQLYLDGLEMAPEDNDLFSKRQEENQSREGAQESEVSNPRKIEKIGVWRTLCPYFKSEVEKGRNVIVRIDYEGSSFYGDDYVSLIRYFVSPGVTEQDTVRSKTTPKIPEVLDHGYENLRDYSAPLPVSLLEKGISSYTAQVGDFAKERKPNPYELFLRKARPTMTVPEKKELLRECCSKFRIGKETDLDRRGRYNRADRVKKFYDSFLKKAEKWREEQEKEETR